MRPIRWMRRGLALTGLGAAGGALAVTTRHLLTTPQPLDSKLAGQAHIDRKHGGDIFYTTAGPESGERAVLLHDFYPGASSYEFNRVWPRLTRDYHVYAPDWLGFGMSEHPPLAYTGEFYANVLRGFLRDVVGQPATLVASGRAANIAARAASDSPELVDRLVLVSPYIESGLRLDPTLAQALVRFANRTSLGLVPYAVLATRPALRYFAMRRGLGAASEDALDHQYAAAHQFGGQHAILAELTGELDLPLQNVLPLLEPPVLLVAGANDTRRPPEQMEDLAVQNPYTDLDTIAGAGSAAHEDQPVRFVDAVTHWIEHEPPRRALSDTLRISTPAAAGTSSRSARAKEASPAVREAERAAAPRITPRETSSDLRTSQEPAGTTAAARTASETAPEQPKPQAQAVATETTGGSGPGAARATAGTSAPGRTTTVSNPDEVETVKMRAAPRSGNPSRPRRASSKTSDESPSASASATEKGPKSGATRGGTQSQRASKRSGAERPRGASQTRPRQPRRRTLAPGEE
jgi:pimeloyl-ACP methyl ester carboxylesterase